MSFGGMIRRVQRYSGLPYAESKEALIMMVETLASRMDSRDRREFAARLPERLQDIALTVYPVLLGRNFDITAQFMYYQSIGKKRAQRQIIAAWKTLEDVVGAPIKTGVKSELSLAAIADLT